MKNLSIFIVLMSFCPGGFCIDIQAKQKMNMLFIMTDQQQYFTMKAYGNNVIHTPNLDKLAANAFVFEHAYVSQAVCSPGRGTIMSGLYPHSHGVINNDLTLPVELPVLPEMLDDESYVTAYIGKWHLGDEIFAQRGFDTWVSMEDGYSAEYSPGRDLNERSDYHHWLVAKGYEPKKTNNRFSRKYAAGLPFEHCKPAFLQENAVDFLESTNDQPFIMYVSFLEPHKPYTGPLDSLYQADEVILPGNFNDIPDSRINPAYNQRIIERVEEEYGTSEKMYRELIARYWGLVSQVDISIGAIMEKLDALGMAENTIVVFTSDHGSMMGAHRMVAKNVMYEESVRVPLLVKDPRMKGLERRIKERISHIDLVPTLLDMLDAEAPSHLQGESLLPFLQGEVKLDRDVFVEWPSVRTIITQDGWKLSIYKSDKSQLFNLNTDPLETNNLFYLEKHKPKVEELSGKIVSWQVLTNDTENIIL